MDGKPPSRVRIPYMKKNAAIAAPALAIILVFSMAAPGCGSRSGAVDWEQIPGPIEKAEVHDLQFDRMTGQIFIATNGRGIWSYDGASFTEINGPLGDTIVFSLQVEEGGDALYAGAGSRGVWRLENGEWSDTGLPDAAYVLLLDQDSGVLYAGSNRTVWSLAGGEWSDTGLIGSKVFSLVHAGDKVVAGTGTGAWSFEDGAWTPMGDELKDLEVRSVASDTAGGILYAGTVTQGVWAYRDGSWSQLPKGPFENPVESLVYDDALEVLLAGTRYGVWTYHDRFWVNTQGKAMEYIVLALAVDDVNTTAYAGTFEDVGIWSADLTPVLLEPR